MPTRVKICGIKSADIMRAALDAGTNDVGLVFFAKSPRNVSITDAAALADIARGHARIVVLTVDANDDVLDEIVVKIRPGLLQLHGRETPARVADIKSRFKTPVMKAIGVAAPGDAEHALAYADVADLILFDAKPPKDAVLPGGNGLAFDWSLIAPVAPKLHWMLSGGLTPANVAAAVRTTAATAVDVSSGVESAPGEKDADLIRTFIATARG